MPVTRHIQRTSQRTLTSFSQYKSIARPDNESKTRNDVQLREATVLTECLKNAKSLSEEGHLKSTPEDVHEFTIAEGLSTSAEQGVTLPTGIARLHYRTKDGKRIPPHHWAVYDLVHTIPYGRVASYKQICTKLGEGSPRSVGGALRRNPFAPSVPCHRVVASDLSVGGFYGEWGTENQRDSKCARKVQILRDEGVEFASGGKVRERFVWDWR